MSTETAQYCISFGTMEWKSGVKDYLLRYPGLTPIVRRAARMQTAVSQRYDVPAERTARSITGSEHCMRDAGNIVSIHLSTGGAARSSHIAMYSPNNSSFIPCP